MMRASPRVLAALPGKGRMRYRTRLESRIILTRQPVLAATLACLMTACIAGVFYMGTSALLG